MLECLYHVAEIIGYSNRLIRRCIKAYHHRAALALHRLCPCVDSPLHKCEALVAKMHDGCLNGNLIRIKHRSDKVGLYIGNNNGKTIVDIRTNDIKEILRLTGVKQLEIDTIVDMSKLIGMSIPSHSRRYLNSSAKAALFSALSPLLPSMLTGSPTTIISASVCEAISSIRLYVGRILLSRSLTIVSRGDAITFMGSDTATPTVFDPKSSPMILPILFPIQH